MNTQPGHPTHPPGTAPSPIRIGARATYQRIITQADIDGYAAITGDFAPHHVDVDFGRRSRFGSTIAHGLFTASLVDGALAALFPQGSLPLRRAMTFTGPVRPGDTVTALAEVTAVEEGGLAITLRTACTNQRGEAVVTGAALERPAPPTHGFSLDEGEGRFLSQGGTGKLCSPAPEGGEGTGEGARAAMTEVLKTVESFRIGDRTEAIAVVTDAHLAAYVELTGGANRLVLDAGAARAAGLADRAVPGLLLAGYAAAALTALVAPGAVTAGHEFTFPAPARPGDLVRSECVVEAIDRDRRLVTVRMRCRNQREECVVDGLAFEKFARPKPGPGGPPGAGPA